MTPTNKLSSTLARLHSLITNNPATSHENSPAESNKGLTNPKALQTPARPAREQMAPMPTNWGQNFIPPDLAACPSVPPQGRVQVKRELPTAPDDLPAGPRRLFELLQRLAVDDVAKKGYAFTPDQHTFMRPQELLALVLGVARETVSRWLRELKGRDLVATRKHVTTTTHRGERVNRSDGTLFAVPLKVGKRPRVPWDYMKAQYRDLDADRRAGKTAYSTVSQSDTLTVNESYLILLHWLDVERITDITPVDYTDCDLAPNSVLDVSYRLGEVMTCHPSRRADVVGQLADGIARSLKDSHSRLYWCKTLWDAFRDETEGRPALQALQAQLTRLQADIQEWAGLKKPAALLVSRLT